MELEGLGPHSTGTPPISVGGGGGRQGLPGAVT